MIYNYTKCESVIAKIMADLDSTEVKQRITDIREWIFEAIDKIGAPMLYISKLSGTDGVPVFQILDNQVPIPSDLVVLDGLAYSYNPNGPWVPMNTTTSIFKEPNRKHNRSHNIITTPPHDESNYAIDDDVCIVPQHLSISLKIITSQSLFYGINTTKYLDKMFGNNRHEQPEYFIKPGWIVTNKNNGFIKIAYKAIATDERGYPLIPDLTSYQEAVYWYVVMKLSFPKWLNGQLGGNSKYAQKYAANSYTYIQLQWNFYRNQAYAEAMMPTADDMKAIKNEWNRLVPEFESDDTFFKDNNKRELIYNDYYNGY